MTLPFFLKSIYQKCVLFSNFNSINSQFYLKIHPSYLHVHVLLLLIMKSAIVIAQKLENYTVKQVHRHTVYREIFVPFYFYPYRPRC